MKNLSMFFISVAGIIALIVFFFWLHFFAPCNFVKYLSTAQSLPARCLSNITNNNQALGISNINTASSTFEKQVQCSNLKDGVIKQVGAFNLTHSNTYQNQYAEGGVEKLATPQTLKDQELFKELFYSPKLDTCIDVIEPQTFSKTATGEWVIVDDQYNFNNAFTGEMIDYLTKVHLGQNVNPQLDYLQKIQEYK